ncbi:hypothetical protein J2Y60_004522 [Arcicella sp. BE140]|nr:hypothetical protein [Arcicella sp. BE51]MDR6814304.1 hypothetical protein [Arcicella sp. BE140]MDR6825674.1 hypothetical protein [Arcicella sp. BE139]
MELITRFWYLQKKSQNIVLIIIYVPLNMISLFNYYKTVMSGIEVSFSLEYMWFGLLIYLPITLIVLFLGPYAYLQKQNREKKDMSNTL